MSGIQALPKLIMNVTVRFQFNHVLLKLLEFFVHMLLGTGALL